MTLTKDGRRFALVLASTFMLGACATIQTGSYSDDNVDFSTFESFSWLQSDPYIAPEGSAPVNPLARAMIESAIQTELQGQGYRYTEDRNDADLLVAYTVGSRDKIRIESYPMDYRGHWGWHDPRSHYYFRKTEARNYTEGTLGVDLFDNETGKPVWHGWAQKTVTAEDRADPEPTINAGIAKLFAGFPE